jgi:glycerophosphoryl diester phosphodiesterase
MPATFELQGHRGARGLKPENTLPAFEVALDVGVTSIETDVHLTRDGVPVLIHDPAISPRLCRRKRGGTSTDPATEPLVSSLTLDELQEYVADRKRLPRQDRSVTPLARWFARKVAIAPYSPPSLAEMVLFAAAYAGEAGAAAGKTRQQRKRAGRVLFDIELKRVPYYPQTIGDDFDGKAPGLLEQRVLEAALPFVEMERLRIRSFDHRSVRAARRQPTQVAAAVLIAETAPIDPVALVKSAGADTYCPDFRFLDADLVRNCHAAGVRVLPWTVNDEADWLRLLEWGVDGITTDYPDRLARLLRKRRIEF